MIIHMAFVSKATACSFVLHDDGINCVLLSHQASLGRITTWVMLSQPQNDRHHHLLPFPAICQGPPLAPARFAER